MMARVPAIERPGATSGRRPLAVRRLAVRLVDVFECEPRESNCKSGEYSSDKLIWSTASGHGQ